MPRIISGKFRGRNLAKSDHLKTLRPTTDANREALFNILNSAKFLKEINFKLENSIILDLCCGTGAIAFEALSRGAKSAILIDNNRSHLELAKNNSEILRIENQCEFFLCDVKKTLPQLDLEPSLIFIDPPYEEDYFIIIKNLLEKNWLKKDSLIIIEFDLVHQPKNITFANLKLLDLRKYGKTAFMFLQFID